MHAHHQTQCATYEEHKNTQAAEFFFFYFHVTRFRCVAIFCGFNYAGLGCYFRMCLSSQLHAPCCDPRVVTQHGVFFPCISKRLCHSADTQERNPCAPKFEERRQDETLKQERCARTAKDLYKLREESRDTFYSPAEAWVMLAPSSTTPEERHFVIDSGASMHMLRKKDLSSGELETLKRSGSPITVVTANGEVQTNEEAQECVHDLHIFVTVQLLEDTPPVLSLRKLCKGHGYTLVSPAVVGHVLPKMGIRPSRNRELRPIGSSRTVIEFHHNFFLDIASAGSIYFIGTSKYAK